MATNTLKKVEQHSVVQHPPATLTPGGMVYGAFVIGHMQDIIIPWGNPARQRQLRDLRHHAHNTLAVSAVSNLIRRFKQIDRELIGGKNLVRRFNAMLQESQFGEGEDEFWERFWWDYFLLDNGGFIEVIAPGASDTPINRAVEGISALDSLRCYATGNPEHPVVYRDYQSGQLYQLHKTRVRRVVDGAGSDPRYRGLGLSFMSRAIAVARLQMRMSQHNDEKLSDLPPAGILTAQGFSETQLETALTKFYADQQATGNDYWRNIMRLASVNPEAQPKIDFFSFSNLPDNFDYKMYLEAHVNLMALALGDDPTELWTLTGGQIGTGAQSAIMHAKGKQRILGSMIKIATTVMNLHVLPPALERRWKPKDTQQSKDDAETADKWSSVADRLIKNGVFNPPLAAQFLANTVSSISDVLLDEQGQVRLPDDDVKPAEQETIADDENDANQGEKPEDETLADDTDSDGGLKQKDIQATRSTFEDAFADFLNNVPSTRSRGRSVATAIVGRAIDNAYKDGLEQGGVDRAEASDEDRKEISGMQKEANRFIGSLLKKLYADELTPAQLQAKPADWFIGSVQPAYFAGLRSADRNGMYEWIRHAARHTEVSCEDCLRLDGQIHRMKDWLRKNLLPGKVKCVNGCGCELVKKEGSRARGRY